MKFILGTKEKTTQVFAETGEVLAATVISAGPITATQIRDEAKDKYRAIQFGFGDKKGKPRVRRERRLAAGEEADVVVGDRIDVSVFVPGDNVTVSGVSKGKGFQGVVRRHSFAGGPRTHGQKHSEREPGSIGGGLRTRVPKGMRMAGRMGSDRVTVKNLRVLEVDKDNNRLVVSGAVPGRRGTLLEVHGV